MTRAQTGMAARFEVNRRAAKAIDDEVGQTFFSASPIVGRVHLADEVILAHPLVEGGDEAADEGFTKRVVKLGDGIH